MSKHHQEHEAAPHQVTIDAIEGNKARVELSAGNTVDWDLKSLPEGVKEGDVIKVSGSGEHQTFEIDQEATAQRHAAAQTQLNALNSTQPIGEIDL